MANPSILILAGDGIGPEVMAEVKKIIGWFDTKRGVTFDVSEDLVGGCAYDVHGTPLTDETMAKAQAADAVLLGRGSLACPSRRRSALTRWPISRP